MLRICFVLRLALILTLSQLLALITSVFRVHIFPCTFLRHSQAMCVCARSRASTAYLFNVITILST